MTSEIILASNKSLQILDSLLAGSLLTYESAELSAQGLNIGRIGNLSEFTTIRQLNLSFNPIDNLNGLGQLAHLKELSAYSCNLSNIEGISGNARLEKLSLQKNSISSLASAFESLAKLRELRIDNNKITSVSNNFRSLTILRTLDLSYNRLENLDGFYSLMSLEELRISHNSISSLRPICKLPKLKELHINYNQLHNLDGLLEMTALETLYAEHNRINRLLTNTTPSSDTTVVTTSRSASSMKSVNDRSNGDDDSATANSTSSKPSSRNTKDKKSSSASTTTATTTGTKNKKPSNASTPSISPSPTATATPSSTSKPSSGLQLPLSLSLADLYLMGNSLRSLEEVSLIGHSLEVLDIRHNLIDNKSTVINAISNLTKLNEIRLRGNTFTLTQLPADSLLHPLAGSSSSSNMNATNNINNDSTDTSSSSIELANLLRSSCPSLRLVDEHALVEGRNSSMNSNKVGEEDTKKMGKNDKSINNGGDLFYTWDNASATSTPMPPGDDEDEDEEEDEEGADKSREKGSATDNDNQNRSKKQKKNKEDGPPPLPNPTQEGHRLAAMMTEEEIELMENGFRYLLRQSRDTLLRAAWRAESEGKEEEKAMTSLMEVAMDAKDTEQQQQQQLMADRKRQKKTPPLPLPSSGSARGSETSSLTSKLPIENTQSETIMKKVDTNKNSMAPRDGLEVVPGKEVLSRQNSSKSAAGKDTLSDASACKSVSVSPSLPKEPLHANSSSTAAKGASTVSSQSRPTSSDLSTKNADNDATNDQERGKNLSHNIDKEKEGGGGRGRAVIRRRSALEGSSGEVETTSEYPTSASGGGTSEKSTHLPITTSAGGGAAGMATVTSISTSVSVIEVKDNNSSSVTSASKSIIDSNDVVSITSTLTHQSGSSVKNYDKDTAAAGGGSSSARRHPPLPAQPKGSHTRNRHRIAGETEDTLSSTTTSPATPSSAASPSTPLQNKPVNKAGPASSQGKQIAGGDHPLAASKSPFGLSGLLVSPLNESNGDMLSVSSKAKGQNRKGTEAASPRIVKSPLATAGTGGASSRSISTSNTTIVPRIDSKEAASSISLSSQQHYDSHPRAPSVTFGGVLAPDLPEVSLQTGLKKGATTTATPSTTTTAAATAAALSKTQPQGTLSATRRSEQEEDSEEDGSEGEEEYEEEEEEDDEDDDQESIQWKSSKSTLRLEETSMFGDMNEDFDNHLLSPRYIPVTKADKIPPPPKRVTDDLGRHFRIPERAKAALVSDVLRLESSVKSASSPNPFSASKYIQPVSRDLEDYTKKDEDKIRMLSANSTGRSHSSFM